MMNAEITKAIKEKNKKHPIRKWWNRNGYKVMRVIFFPIWIAKEIHEGIERCLDNCQEWSEERAHEILSYYIPRDSDWDEETKSFYFFDNGMGWRNLAKRHLKRKDRRWWNNYSGFCGGEIRRYLIDKFELEGFTKEVGMCDEGWTDLTFTLIEKK